MVKTPTSAEVRTWVLMIAGLLVIGYEAVVEKGGASYPIIFAAMMMMGISAPLHWDEKVRNAVHQGVNKVTAPDHAAAQPPLVEASEGAEKKGPS